MTQVTIHRALTLIKNAEEDIQQKLNTGIFISTVQGVAKVPTTKAYKTFDELSKAIQSDTDTVESKFNLIAKLKVAIQQKNLEVHVDFLGKSLSIAELLAIKSTLMLRTRYVDTLRVQLVNSQSVANNADLNISKQLQGMDSNTEGYTQTLTNLGLLQSVSIVSGNSESPAERIKKLQDELRFFNTEIDMLLSETNIVTLIDVDM